MKLKRSSEPNERSRCSIERVNALDSGLYAEGPGVADIAPYRDAPPNVGEGEDTSTLLACAPNIERCATWAESDGFGSLERVLLPKAGEFIDEYWLRENSLPKDSL